MEVHELCCCVRFALFLAISVNIAGQCHLLTMSDFVTNFSERLQTVIRYQFIVLPGSKLPGQQIRMWDTQRDSDPE